MIDPLGSLLTAALIAVAAYLLFRPERGYFWRWRRVHRANERVLIEDALKHLYDFEYRGGTPTVQSLSGALAISGNLAAELLARLEAQELLRSEGEGFRLTPAGRDYALRIIRVHRLWERYLSDETGVREAEWHGEAEYREHDLSPAQADALAEQMGHPVYDPHGDPIPTASGEIAPRRGQPLTTLPVGELAAVVHLEDEPEAVYAQLVAEGLNPGMRVQVSEISPERIRFWGDGDEHVLAPVVAANISVVPLPREQEVEEGPFEPLSALRPGEKGAVVRISRACRGLERRRLLDLGILPGTVIEAEMRSPGGDPTAYRIRGALFALREEQANHIYIARQ
ncbi:FeoA domain-containing protein [bacterium]|nr:FeoA domain-containing protein [bacterium]